MIKTMLALGMLIAASTLSGFAAEPEAILKNMPAAFSGRYVWQGSNETWNMSVRLTERKPGRAGEVEFSGMEYFVQARDRNKKFDSKVRVVINARTLAFDMAEVSEQPQGSDFTPMVYVGKISPDLRTISASWSGDGKKVIVNLTAAVK